MSSSFDNPENLSETADSLAGEGSFRLAAETARRARLGFIALRNDEEAYHAGQAEALYHHSGGDYDACLSTYLSICDYPHAAVCASRGATLGLVFMCYMARSPVLAKLEKTLQEVERLLCESGIGATYLLMKKALLAATRGNVAESLEMNERAFAMPEGDGPDSYHFALVAADNAIALHDYTLSHAWRGRAIQKSTEFTRFTRISLQRLDSKLALFSGNREALEESFANGPGSPTLGSRISILLRGSNPTAMLDPYDPFHPGRVELRTRLETPKDVHDQYDYRLAVVDYHLNSIRFAARLPAVDDLYYQKPDIIPTKIRLADVASFRERGRRFHRAWRRLNKHSRWVDGLLQCNWRTNEAQSRLDRCNRIANAVQ